MVEDGLVSFTFRVSSEDEWDRFYFVVDSLVVFSQGSGPNEWQSLNINVPTGYHTLDWYAQHKRNNGCIGGT